MNYEFIKQKVPDHISTGDEIIIYGHEESSGNGRFIVAQLEEDGNATLVGIGKNEGTISMIQF